MTVAPAHPFLDWSGPIAMAHRGGACEAPENTMVAFQKAVNMGYRYLETDAQVTADGVVLAFHDDDLQRMCGHPGLVGALPYRDVERMRVSGDEPIPTLEETLMTWPDARFNVDCKTDAGVEPLAALLRELDCLHRVCIGTFDDRRMARLRSLLGPRACTGLASRETALLKCAGWGRGGLVAQVPRRHRNVTVPTKRFVQLAHRRGVSVHVWTIDEADEMHRLLDLGVDGIITDRPTVLKQVLIARGQWF